MSNSLRKVSIRLSNEPAWREIEPLLDAAMAGLRPADHDAIVLRFFDDLSFKEVGAILGSTEDAAQKRVTRALAQLRRHFARNQVKVSLTLLASFVAEGAVQSAPAGLAASIASASLTSALSSALTSNFFYFMATTKARSVTLAAGVAILSLFLTLLFRANGRLRHELAAARADAVRAANSPAALPAKQSAISNEESQRHRKEYLELLTLRGQVALLRNEVREEKSTAARAGSVQDPSPGERVDSIILTATSSGNRVSNGNTLIVGGWPMLKQRGYLLITPVIRESGSVSDNRQIDLESRVIRAPDSFWDEIGWGSYKSDAHRSTLAGELTPEQVEFLIQSIENVKDGQIVQTTATSNLDGKRAGVGFSVDEVEGGSGLVMGVDFYPRISSDGLAVDFEFVPTPIPPNIPIHNSLK